MQRIEAQIMIPGRDDPVRDAVVLTDGPMIAYAGPAAEAPDNPDAMSGVHRDVAGHGSGVNGELGTRAGRRP
ncbi:hypothetical protein F7R91_28655 [Streptomyces luteolifulvus]|uniref:Uncharacterized protein n=1 Tax=Streptomyces luteolifulvus TaxID=2615112 RepID=A0A6H9USR7_9ACTN|nr:hypothetical protein [Streptomyces luteolifulvus]KAB1142485.1 hypothetical protein F7R91_28655 [Streptomyces luteolifulvus]